MGPLREFRECTFHFVIATRAVDVVGNDGRHVPDDGERVKSQSVRGNVGIVTSRSSEAEAKSGIWHVQALMGKWVIDRALTPPKAAELPRVSHA